MSGPAVTTFPFKIATEF